MQDNHRLIKDVSNALNYYIDRTRREEAFDLSGVFTPAYDLNQFKLKKLFGYSLAYDEQLKKIMQSDYKTPKISSLKDEDMKLREKYYRDELRYHCRWDRITNINKSKSPLRKPRSKEFEATLNEKRNKSIAEVPAGLITVRNKNTPYLSKREKMSMLNLTSKIMTATEDIILMKNLAKTKKNGPRLVCYEKKSLSKSRRMERDRYLIEEEENKQREAREQEMERRNQVVDELINTNQYQEDDLRYMKNEIENLKIQLINNNKQLIDNQEENIYAWLDDLSELNSGELITYQIVVKTGDHAGSSTEAEIGIVLFGEKGKSKYFSLKRSKRHRIPFRKSNLDIFDVETFDIGQIKAIQIGHFESDIEYNWFMDFLRVEDRVNNISYNFECDDWFGNSAKDKKSNRILLKKNYTQISSEILEKESFEETSRSSSSSSASSNPKSIHSKTLSRTQSKQSVANADADFQKKADDSSARSNTSSIKKKLSSSSSNSSSSKSYSSSSSSRTSYSSSSSSSSPSSSSRSKSSKKSTLSEKSDHKAVMSEEKNISAHAIDIAMPNMNSLEAVEKNSLAELKEIIAQAPTEMNRTDSKGKTLLSIACENGFEEIVKYLVDNNDSLINEENVFGYLPVHSCARYNHLHCLKILYESGASLQIKTNEGQTPLHLAATWGHIEIVEWLCDHKVSLIIMDSNECTAFDLAVKSGHERVANYLANLMGKPLVEFEKNNNDVEPERLLQKSPSSSRSEKKNRSSSSSSSSSDSKKVTSRSSSRKSNKQKSVSEKEKISSPAKLSLPSIKSPTHSNTLSPPNTPNKSLDRISARENLTSKSFNSASNTARTEKVTSPVLSNKSYSSLREGVNSSLKTNRTPSPSKKSSDSRVQSRVSQNLEEKKTGENRKSSTSSSASNSSKELKLDSRKNSGRKNFNETITSAPFDDNKKTIDDLF